MTRIYLFCAGGMSTSLLSAAMTKTAQAHNLDVEIKAFSQRLVEQIVDEQHPEVIMLGPQIKYLYDTFNEKYGDQCAISLIDQMDYATANGDKVLKTAIVALKEFRAKHQ